MKALRGDIRKADGLLVASPVYWFTMSGQAKLFMDRLYVFGPRATASSRASAWASSWPQGHRSPNLRRR